MDTDLEHPDDGDGADLAWLLTSAHDAPEMRPEFASSLAKRLDSEFTSIRAGGVYEQLMTPYANGSSNGAAPALVSLNGRAEAATEEKSQPAAKVAPRSRRRWMISMAVAASLVLAAAIWSNPPAWAAAMRAIVQRIEWIATGGGPIEQADNREAVGVAPQANAQETAKEESVAQKSPAVTVKTGRIAINTVPQPASISNAKSETPAPPAPPKPPIQAAEQATPNKPKTEKSPSHAHESNWKPLEQPLAPEELSKRVDTELVTLWQANGIHPVGPATDPEFMRRVYLDLTGRIPTVSEAHEFFDDKSPNRREALVDKLLESRDHATHMAALWHAVLLPAEVDLSRIGGTEKFDEWLADRFAAKEPYDKIVSDLLLAEGRVADSGPILFYAALKLNPEELAAKTSRAFLGVRLECAQCHNHKFEDISQHDFWSFAAFFARISRPQGKMEVASNVLAVRDNERGDVTIPNSKEVVPPRLPLSEFNLDEKAGGPSRRKQLVAWLTSPNNEHFAKAAVNRVWSILYGRGIVEPVDDMRPGNEPIAPKLLDLLSRDFAASHFDLPRLMRALVLTHSYQLSSRSQDNDPARTLHFAQMNIKTFTADQLYDCIAVSTQKSQQVGQTPSELGLVRFADMSRQAFIDQFRAPSGQATDYHAGIPQALTLMHGGLTQGATDLGTSGLLKSLAAPFFTDEQRLDTLFLSTLSRNPEPKERDLMLKAIASAKSDTEKQQALGDVLWALLNSAEFTFNH
jgi:hypothetical protein